MRSPGERLACVVLALVVVVSTLAWSGIDDFGSVHAQDDSLSTVEPGARIGAGSVSVQRTSADGEPAAQPPAPAQPAAPPRTNPPDQLVPEGPLPPVRATLPRETDPPTSQDTEADPESRAANDFTVFHGSVVSPSGINKSGVLEPSVATRDQAVFYVANRFAARSTDGTNFTHVDPHTIFTPPSGTTFCCDQVVIRDPSRDITTWILQYYSDGAGNNVQRIAVARGSDGFTNNNWYYYDFTAQTAGYPTNHWLDYPHMALGADYFYWTSLVFNGSATIGSVAFRIPLAELASASGLNYQYFTYSDAGVVMTPAQSVRGTTAYFARHISTTTLRVYTWPESSNSISANDVTHEPFVQAGYSWIGPDGANMCGFVSSRIKGGWVSGSELGFFWDAAQGQSGGFGNTNFPKQYIQSVIMNASSKAVTSQPLIWSSTLAFQYGAIAPNARGHLGLSVAYNSSTIHPSSAIGIRDDVDGTFFTSLVTVRNGTHGPQNNRWGDYLAVRPASGDGNTWVATGFTFQGASCTPGIPCGSVEPGFYWFGRGRDNPIPLAITTSSLPSGRVGTAYDQQINASGGTPPYSWSGWGGTIPPGLGINNSTGRLEGTPTSVGTYTFGVRVYDSQSRTADRQFTMTVNPAALAITTSALPAGTVGAGYSQQIQATGGTTPYSWSIQGGALPSGLQVTQTPGRIEGTPTTAGTSTFTLRVTDAANRTADRQLSITINPATPTGATHLIFPVTQGDAVAGQPFTTRPCVFAMKDNDQIDSGYAGTITVALGANPSQGTLGGTTSRPASGGSACFEGLSIDRPGTGYTLRATSGNLTPGTSNAFDVVAPQPPSGRTAFDVNGDGTGDPGIMRPGGGSGGTDLWYVPFGFTGGTGSFNIYFGAPGDLPVMGDYDGDGKADAVIYRPTSGLWYGVRTATGTVAVQESIGWQSGDVPAPADYNGDGWTDLGYFRPSNGSWFGLSIRTGARGQVLNTGPGLGQSGDIPVQKRPGT